MSPEPCAFERTLHSVAAGVSPAVELGILPSGNEQRVAIELDLWMACYFRAARCRPPRQARRLAATYPKLLQLLTS